VRRGGIERVGTLATLLPLALLCQSTPSFEVASVKLAEPSATRGGRASASGDRVSYINTTLKNVLARAYGVKGYQIVGPSWIVTERYDIIAKAPEGTPKEQIPLMLQTLLTERFRLTLHREMKQLGVYALVTADGPKLQTSPETGEFSFEIDNGHRVAKRMSMARLADMLALMVGQPVLDKTGLNGAYDFALDYSMEELGGINRPDAPEAPSIFTIVKQLGLKLDSREAPVETIVIDGGDKIPTEN
jgi:uncharacterized protein (TIGR03435 family)